MPWNEISGPVDAFFAQPWSVNQYGIFASRVLRPAPGGTAAPDLALYVFTPAGPVRWRQIGLAVMQALPCINTVCTLGSEAPFPVQLAVYGSSPDVTWETILPAARAIYGGSSQGVSPAGVPYPRIYAADSGTGRLFQYGGLTRIRAGLRPSGPLIERQIWTDIGPPAYKYVEAGPAAPNQPPPLFFLAADKSGVWQYTGRPGHWIQIGGPADDIVGGTAHPLILIDRTTGWPSTYSGRPMSWIPFAASRDDPAPYAHGGRLAIDIYGTQLYLTPGSRLFLKRTISAGYTTAWLDLGPAVHFAIGPSTIFKFAVKHPVSEFSYLDLHLIPRALPDAFEGSLYAAVLNSVGGVPPYHWTASGAFPQGLRLNPFEVTSTAPGTLDVVTSSPGMNIEGVPEVLRHPPLPHTPSLRFPFTVTAVDRFGQSAAISESILWHSSPASANPAAPSSPGFVAFAVPQDPMGSYYGPLVFNPPYPAAHEDFRVSWIGKNYGGQAITGDLQDRVTVGYDDGHADQDFLPVPYDHTAGLLPQQTYSLEKSFDAGLPAGRYTIRVELLYDFPDTDRISGVNVTSADLDIHE